MRFFCILVFLALSGALPVLGARTSYNESLARQLIHVAAASFGDEKMACLQKAFPREDYEILLPFSAECDKFWDTCAGFIAVSDEKKKLIFAFRGTNTFIQLVDEGIVSFVKDLVQFADWGKVNPYFYRGVDALWPQLKEVLSNPDYEDYDFIFTGHSLGGALAALAAARTVAEGLHERDQIAMYTFGEPRVGDFDFAQKYDEMIENSYRVLHRDDIVPHLPPCEPSFINPHCLHGGMYHHRTEVWYKNSMEPGSQYEVCVREEDNNCSDRKLSKTPADHHCYFGVFVSQYGEKGCDSSELGNMCIERSVSCGISF